jgi:precorrin-2 dehydrogenase/sirohydrochlorin ferrochelatase
MAPDAGISPTPDYPVNLNLSGRRCLVVGGGTVAERKAEALLAAGAEVTVVSPELTARLASWTEQGKMHHLAREFRSGDAAGYRLVLCATDSAAVNEQAAQEARTSGALVNVADTPALCDFTLPARLQRGSLSIAVSTAARARRWPGNCATNWPGGLARNTPSIWRSSADCGGSGAKAATPARSAAGAGTN